MLKFRQITEGFNAQSFTDHHRSLNAKSVFKVLIQSWFLTFAGAPIGYNRFILHYECED